MSLQISEADRRRPLPPELVDELTRLRRLERSAAPLVELVRWFADPRNYAPAPRTIRTNPDGDAVVETSVPVLRDGLERALAAMHTLYPGGDPRAGKAMGDK